MKHYSGFYTCVMINFYMWLAEQLSWVQRNVGSERLLHSIAKINDAVLYFLVKINDAVLQNALFIGWP